MFESPEEASILEIVLNISSTLWRTNIIVSSVKNSIQFVLDVAIWTQIYKKYSIDEL